MAGQTQDYFPVSRSDQKRYEVPSVRSTQIEIAFELIRRQADVKRYGTICEYMMKLSVEHSVIQRL
jgi:hypothetical protein